MARTVAGRAATSRSMAMGLNRRTFNTPTASPRAISPSTASQAVSQPEPISTTTRSAAGWPWNSNRR